MYRVVSLGCDCQPAYQINRHQAAGIPQFFDRIGSTLRGVMRLLETDFDGVLQDENVHPYYVDELLTTVIDTRFRLDFAHDFRQRGNNTMSRTLTARVRSDYEIRARWFRESFDADSQPTYFVRRWDPRDGDDGEDAARELLTLLQLRRRDVLLLYLHKDAARPPGFGPGFRSAFLQQPNPAHWTGLDAAWEQALTWTATMDGPDDGDAFPLPRRQVQNFARPPAAAIRA